MKTIVFFAALLAMPLAAFTMDPDLAQQAGDNPLKWLFGVQPVLVQLFVLTVLSLIGMLGHYLKKWWNDEIAGSLWHYLIVDKPRRTVAALVGVGSAIGAVWLSGLLDTMTIAQVALSVVPTGYMGDSALNKGASPDAIPSQ